MDNSSKANNRKPPDLDKLEAIQALQDSEGWALVRERVERALEQSRVLCETEPVTQYVFQAQGQCKALRAVLDFPGQIEKENKP